MSRPRHARTARKGKAAFVDHTCLGQLLADTAIVTSAALLILGAISLTRCAAQPAEAISAPPAATESYGDFQPSDAPPACLPSGTVTYEAYDSAADMRYWIFLFPDGGYEVAPRVQATSDGGIAPYRPLKTETEDTRPQQHEQPQQQEQVSEDDVAEVE